MAYNAANSLSPMMFKKHVKKDKEGTRNERWRSKSVENIFDANPPPSSQQNKKEVGRSRGATAAPCPGPGPGMTTALAAQSQWKELSRVKALAPVVTCVLPSLAMDFVASSLLAVGAVPLITEGIITSSVSLAC